MFRTFIFLGLTVLIAGCSAAPEGIAPIENFEINRYLGKWYEIARLDHSFERGLTQVTAEYSFREDGGVKVINRGFDTASGEWREAIGKAYFVEQPDKGHLKVSFFGPFYGAYVIFELDSDYRYSFVSGPDRDYLWLLSRSPQVSDEVLKHFVERARSLHFDTESLIFNVDSVR